jgi:hypothetical protein
MPVYLETDMAIRPVLIEQGEVEVELVPVGVYRVLRYEIVEPVIKP